MNYEKIGKEVTEIMKSIEDVKLTDISYSDMLVILTDIQDEIQKQSKITKKYLKKKDNIFS